MSEEILKALMELFALIVKQDGGMLASEREYVKNFLTRQLSSENVSQYLTLFDEHAGPVNDMKEAKDANVKPSVRDSVKILAICKKINRTLNGEQKVIALMRLFELVNADRRFTPQRMNIINTVAEVFNIPPEEFRSIETFVTNNDVENLSDPSILLFYPESPQCRVCEKMQAGYPGTLLICVRLDSTDLLFMKYISGEQLSLNGLPIFSGNIYIFPKGGSLRSAQGYPIYYSDISSRFLSENIVHKISFRVENLSYYFVEGHPAVDDVSFSAEQGQLIGIMGGSGSGKTTLLNLVSGIVKPSFGSVRINGLDINDKNAFPEGVLGYVPQDDLLIEDLTVFENLYYAACLCFKDKTKEEIISHVGQTLLNLGLYEKRDLKVGSPHNKVISGGQRKRLNIALEMIREPSVLLLDEPTSGLSSRDSENLMDLLRELTLKGKLVISVIHQPSSEIFKMFDKILIMDQQGSMAYYGNPVDAVIYFKTLDAQINSSVGECPSCGNINPETIFNIIETQIVDEFGKYTEKRKIKPSEWASVFRKKFPLPDEPEEMEKPHSNLDRPSGLRQFSIYLSRDLKSKLANRQYLMLTLAVAPLLGLILSLIIRYIPDPDSNIYLFSENENIPIYIFMSIIVALFLGLTISAEEIFRDRNILKRERFLNLNRNSYLLSKTVMMLIISAIQTFLFCAVANPVLEIRGLFMYYWIALFTTSFCANMLGLNISSAFNSVITIYIIIPLLIIPMMVLSGAMFPFDKLNRKIGNVEKVPFIAELMPTRWSYEALMVTQFRNNRYSTTMYSRDGESYYSLQKKISESDFNRVYRIPELRKRLAAAGHGNAAGDGDPAGRGNFTTSGHSNPADHGNTPGRDDFATAAGNRNRDLLLLKNEMMKISDVYKVPEFSHTASLSPEAFNSEIADSLDSYLSRLDEIFSKQFNSAADTRDKFYNLNSSRLNKLQDQHYNYQLEQIVTKYFERHKMLIYNNSIVQNVDPVYLDPVKKGALSFRTHFFAPSKYFLGMSTDTYRFNIRVILISSLLLYLLLYFNLPARTINFLEKFKIRKRLISK